MSLWDRMRKNPIDRMKLHDLRAEEIRLNNRIDRTRREIDNNEKKKKKLFQQGIGAGTIKKKMISQEIAGLDMEAKLKLKNFTTAQRMMMFVKNLVVMKNYEKELKNTDTWKKISEIPAEDLESYLINIRLEGHEFEGVLNQLNEVFKMDVAEGENEEVSEAEKKLFEVWDQVEAGSLDVTDAETSFSIDRELEADEED